jgi:hypothetical protein
MKVHLHWEQFDGHLHAACCRVPYDPTPPDPRIVLETAFEKTPRKDRCFYCNRFNEPA